MKAYSFLKKMRKAGKLSDVMIGQCQPESKRFNSVTTVLILTASVHQWARPRTLKVKLIGSDALDGHALKTDH